MKSNKSKDEKEHVESLIDRIKVNERRMEILQNFLKENKENSVLSNNFD